MEKIKFAVVGCGNIGSRHLAILDADPRAEIIAICDSDLEKCEKYSGLYGEIPYFLDYIQLLNEAEPDVINICTPHGLHASMAIQAFRNKINVLVEKPMALTTNDAMNMIATAQKNKVRLMVVRQNRYNVPIALAKRALEEGRLGKVFMVQCNVFWNRYPGYYSNSNWRGKRQLEGGALYTQVSHFLDLMIWWFGEVTEVKADISTKNHDIEIEDCGNALLTFELGGYGELTLDNLCIQQKL